MTDARFPERWLQDRRVLRLSDAGFRLFVLSLAWSVSNRTDGVIYDDDLALMTTTDPDRSGELVKAGLWLRERDRWLIVDFLDTQTSRDEHEMLAGARRRAREKKARQRAKQASPDGAVPGDGPGDMSRGQHRIGQDRTGKARKGKDSTYEETTTTSATSDDVGVDASSSVPPFSSDSPEVSPSWIRCSRHQDKQWPWGSPGVSGCADCELALSIVISLQRERSQAKPKLEQYTPGSWGPGV